VSDGASPLEREVGSWKDFRRSLSRRDQEAFDRIMEGVLSHSGAASNAGRENPFEVMVMSALIDLARRRAGGRG